MNDLLGVAPSGVAAANMLKPCIGVGHVEGDLEDTPQPPTRRAKYRGILCHENGYDTNDPKVSNARAERVKSGE
jgi:hypothetical protein